MKYYLIFILTISTFALGCGTVPPPANAYILAPDLIADLDAQRGKIDSFRITGRVDHFGPEYRIQGKMFLFAKLPAELRLELVSPFGSPLTVLTVNSKEFALHDLREGRYLEGPPEPCNIARLVGVPLPAEQIARILIGHTPVIKGKMKVEWDGDGFYRVTIENELATQYLEVKPGKTHLKLQRSKLDDKEGNIFDITYERWSHDASPMPYEIRIKMPRDQADLLLRYDPEGVELNVNFPKGAWEQSPPDGMKVEHVTCR